MEKKKLNLYVYALDESIEENTLLVVAENEKESDKILKNNNPYMAKIVSSKDVKEGKLKYKIGSHLVRVLEIKDVNYSKKGLIDVYSLY